MARAKRIKIPLESISGSSRGPAGRTIENSSDNEEPMEKGFMLAPGKASSRQNPRRSTRSSFPSATSISSRNSISDEDDYETPGTSAVATPAAEQSMVSRKGKERAYFQQPTDISTTESTLGKRKRNGSEDLIKSQLMADTLLARKLQEEEYDAPGSPIQKRLSIEDSDFEQSELSDLPPEDEEDLLYEEEIEVKKAIKTTTKSKNNRQSTQTKRLNTRVHRRNEIVSDIDQSSGLSSARDSESEFADMDTGDQQNEDDKELISDQLTAVFESTQVTGRTSTSQRVQVRARKNRRSRAPKGMSRAEQERWLLEENHPEIKTLWEDLERDHPIVPPVAVPQPKSINRTLKPFQLEGVGWMIRQEQTMWKGGLLGDEMGMGKTIQAVSLIMSDFPQKDPTLVIVPPVALMQWSTEISSYTDGKLKVLVHHNTDSKVKNLKVKDLMKYNVVMISYAGLESMYRKEIKGWKRGEDLVKENSRIHSIHWHRVILDEAHNIKSRVTSSAKACFALKATYKWCLSGTPVQNRIGEFFSLLRFLEMKPFASYFCKDCPCAALHWEQDATKTCTSCGHTGFRHVSIYNQEILNPLFDVTDPSGRKRALGRLRLLTERIMLRRLKRDQTSAMELPAKRVAIHNDFFGEQERDLSTSVMTNSNRTFDTYVSRGVMLNNYANIFGLILHMRQVANHPDLVLKKKALSGHNVLVCGLCAEIAEEPIRSRCHHVFCRQCARQYTESMADQQPDCPTCHIALGIDFDQPDVEQDEEQVKKNSIINRIKMENWTSSTKIEMLVHDLSKLRSRSSTCKSIVFSQFTSMLQLVEWRLKRAGFKTVMLDGSMSPAQRQKSIEFFMGNVNVEIFLVSLKAGGVALNLTEASQVFIVDPWWNPAAEWQSADRCHRIGQGRPCNISRLVIEDSIESRIVMLQEKKAHLIASTVDRDDVASEKLTPQDMEFLFRGS